MKRMVVLLAICGIVAFAAAQASASSSPIVITYTKTCQVVNGVLQCSGTAGNGGTIFMQVTSFRASGDAGQLTLTEWITAGDISFTADMSGHQTPAGFIVLNGRVTEGPLAGAEVHQRSNLVGGTPAVSEWVGQLQLVSLR